MSNLSFSRTSQTYGVNSLPYLRAKISCTTPYVSVSVLILCIHGYKNSFTSILQNFHCFVGHICNLIRPDKPKVTFYVQLNKCGAFTSFYDLTL